ncbi:MAG: hypothetical protein ABR555_09530 [Pyrinomonadaceae bacterium]
MDLAGDEAKIQALFCELRREERVLAPNFERVWTCARPIERQLRTVFLRSVFVGACALVVATLYSVALWLGDERQMREIAAVTIETTAPLPILQIENPRKRVMFGPSHMKRRSTRSLQTNRTTTTADALIRETVALASWRSPTANLIETTKPLLTNSLPQLDESAKALESFLPGNQTKIEEPW